MTLLAAEFAHTSKPIPHHLDDLMPDIPISSSSDLQVFLDTMDKASVTIAIPETSIYGLAPEGIPSRATMGDLHGSGNGHASTIDLEKLHTMFGHDDDDAHGVGSGGLDDDLVVHEETHTAVSSPASHDASTMGASGTGGGEDQPRQKRKYRRKPQKDPHAPKPPKSAYARFADFQREDPEVARMTFTEIAKLVGVRWRQLSHKEKESWELPAKQDREKYKRDKAAYQKTPKYEEHRRMVELEQFRRKNKLLARSKAAAARDLMHRHDGLADFYDANSPACSTCPSSQSSVNSYESFDPAVNVPFDTGLPSFAYAPKPLEWQPLGSSPTSTNSLADPYGVEPYAGYMPLPLGPARPPPQTTATLPDETIRHLANLFIYKVNAVQYLVNGQWLRERLEVQPPRNLYLLALRNPLVSLCLSVAYQSQNMGAPDQLSDVLDCYVERSWDDQSVRAISLDSMRLLTLMSLHYQYRKPPMACQYLNFALEMGRQLMREGKSTEPEFPQVWTTISNLRAGYAHLFQTMQHFPVA